MIHTRTAREKLEESHLAPFAARSGNTRGRLHHEEAHPYRSEFQRDRDRVVHCRAFRRLEYKTQVFVNGTADHYRTRMTHTIEMAAIGRTIARALRANEDLTEAIALAHDIGHSPFGHCGEAELNKLMSEHGGFDHNVQSLRWVEELEPRYPDFKGLNLTWETRAGLRKHLAAEPDAELDGRPIGPFQYVEAQIADIADDIAYQSHDVDDGLEAGLINEEQLRELDLWKRAETRAAERFPSLPQEDKLTAIVRALLDLQVEDVLETAGTRLEEHRPSSPEDVLTCSERIVDFSPALRHEIDPFRDFLFDRVYWHPEVDDANNEAVQMMRSLFLFYVEHPDTMGRKARARLPEHGLWRTVCDYISGMTDRYAIEEYERFGLGGRS
jgi:dGTPase